MLARAERRHRQTAKLVDKWRLWVAELGRVGVAAKQATLWADEQLKDVTDPPNTSV
jgi:hypothetical protein